MYNLDPTEEDYLKYIFANKYKISENEVKKSDLGKLSEEDMLKYAQ